MRLFFSIALTLAASVLTPIALLACGSSTSIEGPFDAGTDGATVDAGSDAYVVDAGSDAYVDDRRCKTTPSVDEDDWIEAKIERCCGDGLVFIRIMSKDDAGMCQSIAPPSALMCAYCGDGKCKPPETDCNCAEDCH